MREKVQTLPAPPYFLRYSAISSQVFPRAANSTPRRWNRLSGMSGVSPRVTRGFLSGGALRRLDLRVGITTPSICVLLADALACLPFPPLGPLAIEPSIEPSSPNSTSEANNASSFRFGASAFGETGSSLTGSSLTGSSLTILAFGLALRGRRTTVNNINKN